MGAVFGQKFGWERANWFASEGMAAADDWSFRRSKWFAAVGREVVLQTDGAAAASAAGAASQCFLFSPRPPPLGLKSTGRL